MASRPDFEELLDRVRRFEEDLISIGVSVKVDVRGLDAEGHEYGAHEAATCVLCSASERGLSKDAGRGSRISPSALRAQ